MSLLRLAFLVALAACTGSPSSSDKPLGYLEDTAETDTDTDADTDADSDADSDTDTDTDVDTTNAPCHLDMNQDSVDFGETTQGFSVSAPLVVTNDGDQTCTVTDVTLDDSNDLSMTTLSAFVIVGGQSGRFTLTYSPEAPGDLRDTLHILSDDPSHPDLAVPIRGTCPG